MAADYIIDLDCPVKRELGSDGLVRLLKQEGYAWFYLETYEKREGLSREEALQKPMNIVVQRPEGDTMKETTLLEALQEVQVLNDLSHHCTNCPVSMGQRFGCSNSINYPISTKCEAWLGTLIEKQVEKGVDKSPLMGLIINTNITGEHYRKTRQNFAGKILEGSSPVAVVYKKSLFGKKAIDTNQLFDLMIGMQEVPPSLAGILAGLGGETKAVHVIEGDASHIDEQYINDTMSGKIKPTRIEFTPFPGDTSDRGISQFQNYFHALSLAAEHEVSVKLDA